MADRARANRSPDDRLTNNAQQTSDSGGGLGDIVTDVIKDLQDIVRGEVQLAKAELKEDASKIGKALGMIGAGVFFGLVAFIFLMLGVTYVINQWLEMWLSALIVGVALAIVAAIIGMAGKSELSKASLKPDDTIESLKEDKQWANQQIKSVKR